MQSALGATSGVNFYPGEFAGFESPDFESVWGSTPELELTGFSGVKRPNLLHFPLALAKLNNAFPESQVICVLRDPVSRFISAAVHNIKMGIISFAGLDQIVENCTDTAWLRRNPRATELLNFGLYSDALAIAEGIFGSRMHVFGYQSLQLKPTETMLQIAEKCGLGSPKETLMVLPRKAAAAGTTAELMAGHWSSRVRYSYSAGRLRLRADRGPVANEVARLVEKIGRSVSRFSRRDPKAISDASVEFLRNFYEEDRLRLAMHFDSSVVYWSP